MVVIGNKWIFVVVADHCIGLISVGTGDGDKGGGARAFAVAVTAADGFCRLMVVG